MIDFLVAGGGPAGCAFAMLAARAGASVVLLERDDYQDHRPGEHLAGRVRPLLDALKVPKDDTGMMAAPSPGIYATWNGDDSLVKMYGTNGQAGGLHVVRHRFDEWLCRTAREAGAVTIIPGRAVRVERTATDAWCVTIAEPAGRSRAVVATSLVDATGRSASIGRRLGARCINHGDLVAIVRWIAMTNPLPLSAALLTVESCARGWWSLSALQDHTLVATLYTSLTMMRSARATPETWWMQALDETEDIAEAVRMNGTTDGVTRAYRAGPSRLSQTSGAGWIAIGDAAIAFDPLAGQGVALALETAFRAFEAACVDPLWEHLGTDYNDALLDRFDRHLKRRHDVYGEASDVLSPSFVDAAVIGRAS